MGGRAARCDGGGWPDDPNGGGHGEWFKIMALHQARTEGGRLSARGSIRDTQLPSCMDVICWGGEKECKIEGGMDALPEALEFTVVQVRSRDLHACMRGCAPRGTRVYRGPGELT